MKYILTLIVTLVALNLSAQELPERGMVRRGNREFIKNEYKEAVESYEQAHTIAPESFEALYNYANALYKDEQYAKAEELYLSLDSEKLSAEDSADVLYNLGNSQFQQQKYQEALESYKSVMRTNPDDQQAKYNYAYTKKLLEQQEQDQDQNQDQEQNENQDSQDNQDQNGDNQEQTEDNQEQNEDNQEQNQDNQNQDQEKPQESQPQQSEGRISEQEQAQMLDAIQAQEDKTQEKLEQESVGVMVRGGKNW